MKTTETEKNTTDDPVIKVTGCLKLDKDTDMLIAEMRRGYDDGIL